MRQVTLRGLLAHKLRLVLTALAIVLGVTFISGTFVLTDTLDNTFSALFTSVYSKIDFQVRGVAQFGSGQSATRNPLPDSLLPRVQAVPGVAAASGNVYGIRPVHRAQWQADHVDRGHTRSRVQPQPADLQPAPPAGSPPTASDNVVMDAATAKSYNFSVGQQVRVLGGGLKSAETFRITGIARFGTADNLAGQTLAAFTLPTAQRVVGEPQLFDFISVVAKPGADKAAVQRSIAHALPPSAEVVTGQTIIDEDAERGEPGTVVLQHGAADLRADIAIRRRVHHLQHVLDHRWPADTGTRPAARRRREPGTGAALRADRGGDRRIRLISSRGRARRGRRHRA